jgi:hypothetical protein
VNPELENGRVQAAAEEEEMGRMKVASLMTLKGFMKMKMDDEDEKELRVPPPNELVQPAFQQFKTSAPSGPTSKEPPQDDDTRYS